MGVGFLSLRVRHFYHFTPVPGRRQLLPFFPDFRQVTFTHAFTVLLPSSPIFASARLQYSPARIFPARVRPMHSTVNMPPPKAQAPTPHIPITAQPQQYHAGSSIGHSIPLVEGRRALRGAGVEPEGAPCNKGVGDVGTGPVRIQEQNRTESKQNFRSGCLFSVRSRAHCRTRATCARESREHLVSSWWSAQAAAYLQNFRPHLSNCLRGIESQSRSDVLSMWLQRARALSRASLQTLRRASEPRTPIYAPIPTKQHTGGGRLGCLKGRGRPSRPWRSKWKWSSAFG